MRFGDFVTTECDEMYDVYYIDTIAAESGTQLLRIIAVVRPGHRHRAAPDVFVSHLTMNYKATTVPPAEQHLVLHRHKSLIFPKFCINVIDNSRLEVLSLTS